MKKIKIKSLQPSQLYLSQKKLDAIRQWLDPQNNEPSQAIIVRKIADDLVILDGHSRAFVAMEKGCEDILVDYDEKDQWPYYEDCVRLCQKRHIYSVSDLKENILNEEDYKEKWITFCQNLRPGSL
ncbi:hypothetical protein [Streptococcus catagoni]|uniref:hypothetical protein n=1 Tax=Streptococcus catagoni TaxID=2654874 RepID=UPI00140E814F|nr:hypothetical protein [Streptococcus catagoni]